MSALTSGTEADRILNELARVLDAHAGVTVARREGRVELDVEGDQPGFRENVDAILSGINLSWRNHVRIED